jgi:hypothetical protein
VVSKAMPKHVVEGYGIKKIFWFDGVDEVAWIQRSHLALSMTIENLLDSLENPLDTVEMVIEEKICP